MVNMKKLLLVVFIFQASFAYAGTSEVFLEGAKGVVKLSFFIWQSLRETFKENVFIGNC